MNNNFSAAIIAGGNSTRMGFDKQYLTINEKRLLDRTLTSLSKLFSEIIVITKTPEAYSDFNVSTFCDIFPSMGPLTGIHSALANAPTQNVYMLACDMPHVELSYISYLENIVIRYEPDACITQYGLHIEPFNAIYCKTALPQISQDLSEGKASINKAIKKLNTSYISEKKAREFSPNWEMFLNLNTPKELADFCLMES